MRAFQSIVERVDAVSSAGKCGDCGHEDEEDGKGNFGEGFEERIAHVGCECVYAPAEGAFATARC